MRVPAILSVKSYFSSVSSLCLRESEYMRVEEWIQEGENGENVGKVYTFIPLEARKRRFGSH
jgi:hypothetical protein